MQTTDTSNFFRTENELAKDQARKDKALRTKDLGDPLELPGKILNLKIRGSDAWTAESGHVVRCLSLETRKTKRLFKGHAGPVTCLAFYELDTLFTGSWDKTIRTWRISDGSLLSSTQAHSDFVKALLVIPSLSLLVSGSSDKVTRFWDLSSDLTQPLKQLGSVAMHSRPVEALAFEEINEVSVVLYTADTMGVTKVWELVREYGSTPGCRAKLRGDLQTHRIGVNDIWVGKGLVWTASGDDSVLLQPSLVPSTTAVQNPSKFHTIQHPTAVRAILPLALTPLSEPYLITASGDVLRSYAYDVSAPDDPPELLGEIDAHWHDVTALGLWLRVVEANERKHIETWILSASLDATLRCWRLEDILHPRPLNIVEKNQAKEFHHPSTGSALTEEEERELEELLGDDC